MEIFAFCCRSFEDVTRRAAGVEPLTCPPVTAMTFDVAVLERRDFIYFDLHGEFGGTCWFGDEGIPALTAEQIRHADLSGAVVFAANCYLADGLSPMLEALLDAGARYVIAGAGQNWGPASGRMYGAPLLGRWVRMLMALGMGPLEALTLGKRRVAMEQTKAAKDTGEFKAFKRIKN